MAWMDAFTQQQFQQNLRELGRISPGKTINIDLPEPICKWHGKAHRYACIVPDPDRPVLLCDCGDVLWKERPKDAQAG